VAELEATGDDADRQVAVGVEWATRQTRELVAAGVPGIHYYVMNRSESVARVLGEVTLPPSGAIR
jgi:methylenetetrahydrofolate reductase (NADPH)